MLLRKASIAVGFAFLPEYEGKGYAKESSDAVIYYAKKSLNINQLAAITVPNNLRSIQLLKKLNFGFEKTIQLENDKEELMLFKLQLG